MTHARFLKIAKETTESFWVYTFDYLTPEEASYIRSTPTAYRNLERRIVYALAQSLLTTDQISLLEGLVLEEPQSELPTAEHTAKPKRPTAKHTAKPPRKEAHP